MKDELLVSVFMITYNHESFISQAIEGVLMQKINFRLELVIGEDCSTDNTRKICLKYKEKYPDIIRLLLPNKNIGMKQNTNQTLDACQGKYIAMCEGDDYWTDPLKLQKQFDIMENDESISMIFHDATIVNSKGEKITTCSRYRRDQIVTNRNLILKGSGFCPTASLFFRANYIKSGYPDFCLNCHVGDHPLQLYLATQGKVYYLTEKMCVYRLASNDTSWTIQFSRSKLTSQKINSFKSSFVMLEGISNLWDNRYSKEIFECQADYFIYVILFPAWNESSILLKEFEIYIKKFRNIDKCKIALFVKCYPLLWMCKNYRSVKKRIAQFFYDKISRR